MNPLRTTVAPVLAPALAHPAASVLAKSPKGKAVHGAIAINRDTRAVGCAYGLILFHFPGRSVGRDAAR